MANCKEPQSFVDVISRQLFPECISFDHDLGMDEKGILLPSGYGCAKWLISYIQENNLELPHVLCHSINLMGRENILSLFEAYKKNRR